MEKSLQQLNLYGTDYQKLKVQFFEFTKTLDQLTKQIPSLSKHRELQNHDEEIYIRFLGKSYVIRLEYDTQVINGSRGLLVSYLVNPLNNFKDLEEVNRVVINDLGNAKTSDHTNGYPWSINSDGDILLLTLLNL